MVNPRMSVYQDTCGLTSIEGRHCGGVYVGSQHGTTLADSHEHGDSLVSGPRLPTTEPFHTLFPSTK